MRRRCPIYYGQGFVVFVHFHNVTRLQIVDYVLLELFGTIPGYRQFSMPISQHSEVVRFQVVISVE